MIWDSMADIGISWMIIRMHPGYLKLETEQHGFFTAAFDDQH